MLTGIDHVIIAVAHPDAAASALEAAVGLRPGGGGRHDQHGTFNRLIWLGDSYVELVGVFDRARALESWFGRSILPRLAAADGAYAGQALSSADIGNGVLTLRSLGSSIADVENGQRIRPDGRLVGWQAARLADPDPDLGLAFLIEHDLAGAEWTDAERAARAAEEHPLGGAARLVRVELPVGTMQHATMRLHRDLGLAFRPSLSGGGARDTSIGTQLLRLVPSAQKRPPTIVIRGGAEPREAMLLGCRWIIEPAISAM